MSTVALATATLPPICGLTPSTSGQVWKSEPARQAGWPPISTVARPGPPASGEPWLVSSPTRAAGWPIAFPSIDLHQAAANGHRGARLDLERRRGLDGDRLRLDRELPARLDVERAALAVDAEAIALAVVEADAVVVDREPLAVLQLEFDEPLAAVVEQQPMSLARLDQPPIVLAVRIGGRRPFLAVPQGADHAGKAHVAAIERDQHLLPDFRQEIRALPLARHRHGEARPIAYIRILVPGKAHRHARESVRITVLGDHGDGDAGVNPNTEAYVCRPSFPPVRSNASVAKSLDFPIPTKPSAKSIAELCCPDQ